MPAPDPERCAQAVGGMRRLSVRMVMPQPALRRPRCNDRIEILRRFRPAASG